MSGLTNQDVCVRLPLFQRIQSIDENLPLFFDIGYLVRHRLRLLVGQISSHRSIEHGGIFQQGFVFAQFIEILSWGSERNTRRRAHHGTARRRSTLIISKARCLLTDCRTSWILAFVEANHDESCSMCCLYSTNGRVSTIV